MCVQLQLPFDIRRRRLNPARRIDLIKVLQVFVELDLPPGETATLHLYVSGKLLDDLRARLPALLHLLQPLESLLVADGTCRRLQGLRLQAFVEQQLELGKQPADNLLNASRLTFS